jgi:hypothetical protein
LVGHFEETKLCAIHAKRNHHAKRHPARSPYSWWTCLSNLFPFDIPIGPFQGHYFLKKR